MTPEEPEGMPEALRTRLADFLDAEVSRDWELAYHADQDNRPRWSVRDLVGYLTVDSSSPTDPARGHGTVMGFHPGEHPPEGVLAHVVRHDPLRVVYDCATWHLLISLFRSSEPGPLDEVVFRMARAYQDSPDWSDDFLG